MARPKRSNINPVDAEGAISASPIVIQKQSIVKPLIKVAGEKNLLEELYEDPEADLPELTAVGFFNLNMGRYTWVSYKVTLKGDKVLSIEVSEPDMREIAYEAAKIEFEQSMGVVKE